MTRHTDQTLRHPIWPEGPGDDRDRSASGLEFDGDAAPADIELPLEADPADVLDQLRPVDAGADAEDAHATDGGMIPDRPDFQ